MTVIVIVFVTVFVVFFIIVIFVVVVISSSCHKKTIRKNYLSCLLAKNEATVEKNQNPLFVEMEGGNWRDLHFMTAWYYILCAATSVYPQ